MGKLRSVTIDDAGNWQGQNPISIQSDYGFTTAIYIDCYKDYEFTVFDSGRFMLVPPYTPSLLVDWDKMDAKVNMEDGDQWVLQIETIHNPTGYIAGQEGIQKMALCDEELRNPADQQTTKYSRQHCDSYRKDCHE